MSLRSFAAIPLVLGALSGCVAVTHTCTDEARSSFAVLVTDAATGKSACDATVTAVQGTRSIAVPKQDSPVGCSYVLYEQAGDFTVLVHRDGYVDPPSSHVSVPTESECHHVITQPAVTVALKPAPI